MYRPHSRPLDTPLESPPITTQMDAPLMWRKVRPNGIASKTEPALMVPNSPFSEMFFEFPFLREIPGTLSKISPYITISLKFSYIATPIVAWPSLK